MKNILIEIKAVIKQTDEEPQIIEMTTEGEWFEKNNALFIVYYESEISGMEGSKTMLKIDNQVITMTRFGQSHSKMVFKANEKSESVYHTPYGVFDMAIHTLLLEHDFKDYNGSLKIEYEMALEAISTSQNFLEIKVRPL
ncbi:MAG: DUF1934 domain-containing protein [Clostridia bacterium]|nr:DUF1934 domain-containing protein [Clostridia bacterium]